MSVGPNDLIRFNPPFQGSRNSGPELALEHQLGLQLLRLRDEHHPRVRRAAFLSVGVDPFLLALRNEHRLSDLSDLSDRLSPP